MLAPPCSKPVVGVPPPKPPKEPPKPVAIASTEKVGSSNAIEKIVRVVGSKEKKVKDVDALAKPLLKPL